MKRQATKWSNEALHRFYQLCTVSLGTANQWPGKIQRYPSGDHQIDSILERISEIMSDEFGVAYRPSELTIHINYVVRGIRKTSSPSDTVRTINQLSMAHKAGFIKMHQMPLLSIEWPECYRYPKKTRAAEVQTSQTEP